jgi:hypothetical protein
MSDKKDWHCIQAQPTIYAYGHLVGAEVHDITATVERLDSGSWRWRLAKWSMQGIEPSAEIAKQVAIKQLEQGPEG